MNSKIVRNKSAGKLLGGTLGLYGPGLPVLESTLGNNGGLTSLYV